MFKLEDIIKASGGNLLQGDLKKTVRGVSTDTRKIKKGDLFVAIRGENYDGHHFIAQAVEQGARAVLIQRDSKVDLPSGVAVVAVDATVKALGIEATVEKVNQEIEEYRKSQKK